MKNPGDSRKFVNIAEYIWDSAETLATSASHHPELEGQHLVEIRRD